MYTRNILFSELELGTIKDGPIAGKHDAAAAMVAVEALSLSAASECVSPLDMFDKEWLKFFLLPIEQLMASPELLPGSQLARKPDATYALGLRFYKGEGVDKSAENARIWWERAAACGSIKAKCMLPLVL